jgi:hypothetical protein
LHGIITLAMEIVLRGGVEDRSEELFALFAN